MVFVITIVFLIAIVFWFYFREKKLKLAIAQREKEVQRRMYELAILKELGDRIGYSLNIQNIIDVIVGSLHQFLEYGAVSYMFLEPEKLIFRVHLEKSVSRNFIGDIQRRMLKSLAALAGKDFADVRVEEVLSGAILVEGAEEPVRSFFNIPLVIAGKLAGVLTVAHVKEGLYKEEEMTILYKIVAQASDAVTRLQEVVETERGKLSAMVESMSEGVVMTDRDLRLMVVNPAAKRIFNFEAGKEISIFDLIDGLEGKFDLRAGLEGSLKQDKVLTAEEVILGDRFYQIIVSPVKSYSGLSRGMTLGGVVIFHDITREKEIEKLREDFTSMIAHELRSPIDQIKKMSEFLRIRPADKEKISEFLQMIYQTSSGLLELVNNLLDEAKLEAGKFTVFKTPSDVKEIIRDRVNFFKTSAREKRVSLVAKIAKNIPAKIGLDSVRIAQVVNNFLSNALKFTPARGKIKVQALIHRKGGNLEQEASVAGIEWFLTNETRNLSVLPDSLVVAVTDSGEGISPEEIPYLFNKFRQVGKTSEAKKAGTGLGLVVAKGIIEAQAGLVGIESKVGQGTTAYFTIPLVSE